MPRRTPEQWAKDLPDTEAEYIADMMRRVLEHIYYNRANGVGTRRHPQPLRQAA